ncbi:MAG: SDR family oxidoreductase, partial [Pseudomonadales bacterium]
VNAICPGGISTPGVEHYLSNSPSERETLENSHAMGRLGTPDEVAYAASYLCSDRASFITGHALPVDGEMSFHH